MNGHYGGRKRSSWGAPRTLAQAATTGTSPLQMSPQSAPGSVRKPGYVAPPPGAPQPQRFAPAPAQEDPLAAQKQALAQAAKFAPAPAPIQAPSRVAREGAMSADVRTVFGQGGAVQIEQPVEAAPKVHTHATQHVTRAVSAWSQGGPRLVGGKAIMQSSASAGHDFTSDAATPPVQAPNTYQPRNVAPPASTLPVDVPAPTRQVAPIGPKIPGVPSASVQMDAGSSMLPTATAADQGSSPIMAFTTRKAQQAAQVAAQVPTVDPRLAQAPNPGGPIAPSLPAMGNQPAFNAQEPSKPSDQIGLITTAASGASVPGPSAPVVGGGAPGGVGPTGEQVAGQLQAAMTGPTSKNSTNPWLVLAAFAAAYAYIS